MKYTILITLFFGAQWAIACGYEIGEIKPGNKIVNIEIKDAEGASSYIVDDDGLMALTLAAGACNRDVEYVSAGLGEKQKKCGLDAQYEANIDFHHSISFDFYYPSISQLTETSAVIEKKCHFSAIKVWDEALKKFNSQPLKCADKVKSLMKRAAARNEEYFTEQTDPEYLKGLKLSEKRKADLVKQLSDDKVVAHNFAQMFSQTPLKVGDFKKGLETLKSIAKTHGYQISTIPNQPFNPLLQQDMDKILYDLQAPLPFVGKTRCGRSFPDDLITQLNAAQWLPRSEQGTSSSNKGGQ